MKIWKLSIADANSENWSASTYKGNVFVRAETETKARQVATKKFAIATHNATGQDIRISPWSQKADTKCSICETTKYPLEGSQGILGTEDI